MLPVFYEHRPETLFAGFICDHPFPSHVHDVTEIVCLLTGRVEMTIGGKQIALSPGDVAVAFPSVPHSYDYVAEDASGLTLIFAPDTISEFNHAFRTMLPVDPLIRTEDKAPEMDLIIHALIKQADQEVSSLRLGYLHLLLSYLFSCLPLEPMGKNVLSGMVSQVLHYVSEHFTEPLTLENTARALGISRIHLSHIFSQQLHINFRQYINILRIDRACTLLKDPSFSISQIADLCGYGNSRTFHRAFLAQRNMAPNEFRTKMNGSRRIDAEAQG